MSIKEPTAKFHELEMRVQKTIRDLHMIVPGEHVLVAVSGGADSTALLRCLHRLVSEFSLTLTVAHLNHRIRGLEGDADAEFVRQMSSVLELSFISETIEVKQQAEESGENLEDLARRRRYDFLRRTAMRVGAQKIAVGHNQNDQAETALFRFIRGSGLEGLSAIHPVVDGLIIRPLIDCPRDLIGKYLSQTGACYREDSTNEDLQYARNRIRRELVPYLQSKFNPQLIPTLARETLIVREAWSYIELQSEEAYQTVSAETENGLSLAISGILDLHPALQKQVLRRAVKQCLGSLEGVGHVHIDSLLSLCRNSISGEKIQIPHGATAIRQFNTLLLLRQPPDTETVYAYSLDLPGQCNVPEVPATFRCTICTAPGLPVMKQHVSHQAYLNPGVLPKSLTIRSKIPGDRYGGPEHRKVKKMLIDGKIPLLRRASLPMIVAGNDVIWIPGFKPARIYAAKPGTDRCILIEMIR